MQIFLTSFLSHSEISMLLGVNETELYSEVKVPQLIMPAGFG